LGVDRPIAEQYIEWLGDLAFGDLGRSLIRGREPVTSIMQRSLAPSIQLGLMVVTISTTVGVAVGVLSAVKRGGILDYGPRVVTVLFLAVPNFWLLSMVLLLGARLYSWSPPSPYAAPWDDPLQNLAHLFWPAVIVGITSGAVVARYVRSTMLDVLGQDYVRTAVAKGLPPRTVVVRHALRNTLLPLITLVGLQLGGMLSGVLIAEVLFSIPGMGRALLQAIQSRDYPVVQGMVLVIGLVYLFVSFAVDLAYGLADPRVRARFN
jgi:peptide/nickel transport system permease protein